MKIGVISKRPSYWSTQALLKSIKEHGHEPTLIKTDEVRLVVAGTDDATFSGASLRDAGDRRHAGEEPRGDRFDRRHAEVLRRGRLPPRVHPESRRRHPSSGRRRTRDRVDETDRRPQRMAGEHPSRGEGRPDRAR